MKTILILFTILCLFSNPVQSEELVPNAKSAYLIEYSTGKVLYEKNCEERLYPASMTKMMSLILVYEALNNNTIQMDQMITISLNASSMGGSQIYLEENEQMSVSDLLKSVCISSSNDAIVALAETISGSVLEFVNKMNEKAKEYNLINTNFENTTGLHHDNHYSCAKDMAIIAQKLIEIGKEELLETTSTYDSYIRENSEQPFWLVNTNKLIKSYDYVDGLKTGFTQEALSCITVTAKKDNIRLIGVVMKEPDSKTRNKEVMNLINMGFSKVKYQPFYKTNDIYADYEFETGIPHNTKLIYLENVGLVIPKEENVNIISQEFIKTNHSLPLNSNDKIGELIIKFDNQEQIIIDIGVQDKIEKMIFLDYFVMSFWRGLT